VDPEHAQALYDAFLAFDKDDTADVAVFWGEGGAFCAGADLKRVATRDNKKVRGQLDFPKDREAVRCSEARRSLARRSSLCSYPACSRVSFRGG
jgi:enoyl-CoA hydratase/carnithine racemase